VIVQIDTTKSCFPSQHPHYRGIERADIVLGSAQSTGFGVLRGIPKGQLAKSQTLLSLTVLHEEVSLGYEYQLFLGIRDTVIN